MNYERKLDGHALVLPFHASASAATPAAKKVSGRRGVGCGKSECMSTSRAAPGGLRDGLFEALSECGVCEAKVAGVPHLGWVNGSKRLAVEE